MIKSVRVLLVIATLALAAGFLTRAGLVNAKGDGGHHAGWANQLSGEDVHNNVTSHTTLPGNGYGDKNHTHTGPPGQTSVPEPDDGGSGE